MSDNKTFNINFDKFYETYHGHDVGFLETIHNTLLKNSSNPSEAKFIYLAGDSSLDNKYWISKVSRAINGYEKILYPPNMKNDICYHLNKLANGKNIFAINTSVEATTLASRKQNLFSQDQFIINNIKKDDILIVSVGGNDIALQPSIPTIWNMFKLNYFNDLEKIKKGPNYAWGMNHMINIFKNDTKEYIEKLISKTKPSKVIICMIYYPDTNITGSWADRILGYAGYNSDPLKLQSTIKQLYLHATCKIKIKDVEVIPFPMFKFMDGNNTYDYVQRVEPSDLGGEKLAKGFMNIILKE